jgi:hypothetical protein
MVGMDNIAAHINEYHTAEEQLALLQDAECKMQTLNSQVESASSSIRRRQELLSSSMQNSMKMQKRLQRNEKPHVFHFLVCDRKGKVQHLKKELETMASIEQDLSNKISTESTHLEALQKQQDYAHALVDRKHLLESRSRQLFDEVVDAEPTTQSLQNLHANLQQQSVLITVERGLLPDVGQSIAHLQQGLARFHRAGDLYKQASSVNERATNLNKQEEEEASARKSANKLRQLQERQLQGERDSLVSQANDLALRGYDAISSALSAFPSKARARYPQICLGIGHVAFPCVYGADFSSALMVDAIFGAQGAASEDCSSGCKIRHNISVMENCMSISSSQLILMTAVDGTIRAAISQIEASLRDLEQGVVLERTRVFNLAQAKVFASVTA